jgi:hypothetical protein
MRQVFHIVVQLRFEFSKSERSFQEKIGDDFSIYGAIGGWGSALVLFTAYTLVPNTYILLN